MLKVMNANTEVLSKFYWSVQPKETNSSQLGVIVSCLIIYEAIDYYGSGKSVFSHSLPTAAKYTFPNPNQAKS